MNKVKESIDLLLPRARTIYGNNVEAAKGGNDERNRHTIVIPITSTFRTLFPKRINTNATWRDYPFCFLGWNEKDMGTLFENPPIVL